VDFEDSALSDWSPEQIAQGKRWIQARREAGPLLEQVRRRELRELDAQRAVAQLCGPADYRDAPRALKATSGLVEQQRWFMMARSRD
jgi:hypothetical protein